MNKISNYLAGLPSFLVDRGLLEEIQAKNLLKEAFKKGKCFITYIVEENIVEAAHIAIIFSQAFKLPLLNLSNFDKSQLPTSLMYTDLIIKHHALPLFERHEKLYIALSDPTDLSALKEFKCRSKFNTQVLLVEEDKLSHLINSVLATQNNLFKPSHLKSLSQLNFHESYLPQQTNTTSKDDCSIIQLVHKIIVEAINQKASDIHFEPYESTYRVRFRKDGILYDAASPPLDLAGKIATRLKVMSQLDISERRIPQDGHFKITVSPDRSVDLRISTCPTITGEKVVLRILDLSTAYLDINALGFEPFQKKLFFDAIYKSQGMVLVTGPTGSGKTISLYTALQILNNSLHNIISIEDPVEIHLTGINQITLNLKAGLDFPHILKAILRQDPDIIMVGEIRDLETAEIAIKAAQTGHLVLSTLHTNNAIETITRLVSMGIPTFNIVSSISLIVAQRLVRRLCSYCKIAMPPSHSSSNEQKNFHFIKEKSTPYNPYLVGCQYCNKGYSGRIGIYEMLPMSDEMIQMILANKSSLDIMEVAKKSGMLTLKEAGLNKVAQGVTSLAEINRIIEERQ